MATFTKLERGWRVRVRKAGQSYSACFPSKASAQEWATRTESEIISGRLGKVPDKTFADLVDRYLKEVTPSKRGARQESFRLKNSMDDDLGKVRLPDLGPEHIAAWRDRRLKSVSGSSVNREWNTLSNVCQVAVKEWRWLKFSPFATVKRPKESDPRQRTISDDEKNRILLCCGDNCGTVRGRIGAAFEFALETAMRAGEICSLHWPEVRDDHVHLPMTKNGSSRDVPLSPKAKEILEKLRVVTESTEICFGLSSASLDATFRKIKVKALCPDIHFHDTRRTALTRLAVIYNVMELARISGHTDLKIIQSVYFAPAISDLARKLTPPPPASVSCDCPAEVAETSGSDLPVR